MIYIAGVFAKIDAFITNEIKVNWIEWKLRNNEVALFWTIAPL